MKGVKVNFLLVGKMSLSWVLKTFKRIPKYIEPFFSTKYQPTGKKGVEIYAQAWIQKRNKQMKLQINIKSMINYRHM